MTIMLTTHNMEEAETLCDKVAIMNKGRLLQRESLRISLNNTTLRKMKRVTFENVFLYLTGKELV